MKKVVYVIIFLIPSFLCAMNTPQPSRVATKSRVTISRLQKDNRVIFPNSNVFEVPASDSIQQVPSKRSSPTFNRVKEQLIMDHKVVRGKKLSLDEQVLSEFKK